MCQETLAKKVSLLQTNSFSPRLVLSYTKDYKKNALKHRKKWAKAPSASYSTSCLNIPLGCVSLRLSLFPPRVYSIPTILLDFCHYAPLLFSQLRTEGYNIDEEYYQEQFTNSCQVYVYTFFLYKELWPTMSSITEALAVQQSLGTRTPRHYPVRNY